MYKQNIKVQISSIIPNFNAEQMLYVCVCVRTMYTRTNVWVNPMVTANRGLSFFPLPFFLLQLENNVYIVWTFFVLLFVPPFLFWTSFSLYYYHLVGQLSLESNKNFLEHLQVYDIAAVMHVSESNITECRLSFQITLCEMNRAKLMESRRLKSLQKCLESWKQITKQKLISMNISTGLVLSLSFILVFS